MARSSASHLSGLRRPSPRRAAALGLGVAVLVTIAVLVATRSSDDPVRSDWWLGEPPSGAELAVVTFVGSSSCNEFDRVEVSQSDKSVVVRSYVTRSDGDCTADYSIRSTPVTLDEPLGDRRLEGCVAPAGGNRAGDLPHDDARCAELVRPDYAKAFYGRSEWAAGRAISLRGADQAMPGG